MSIKYGSLNVDERYSGILEPNLYYNPVLVPGVTCTDKYQIGPAGQIYVHKLTTSAVESGTPGRDFSDTAVSDTLIPIQLNNNFQRSYKIYGVQAAAVEFGVAEEALSTATQEIREGWMQCGLACLAQEGTAATLTTAITDVKEDIIATRQEIVEDKGRANVVMCTPLLQPGPACRRQRLHSGHERPDRQHRKCGTVAGHDLCGSQRRPRLY